MYMEIFPHCFESQERQQKTVGEQKCGQSEGNNIQQVFCFAAEQWGDKLINVDVERERKRMGIGRRGSMWPVFKSHII